MVSSGSCFPALSPPPSELHHTKEVGSRQYKEDLGGVRHAGGDEICCVLMQFFDECADRIRIEVLYSNSTG